MEDLSQISLSDVNIKNTNHKTNSFFDDKKMEKYVDEYLLLSNDYKYNIIQNFKKSQQKKGFVPSDNYGGSRINNVGGGINNVITIINNFNFGKDNNFKILNIKKN